MTTPPPDELPPELAELLRRAAESPRVRRPRRQRMPQSEDFDSFAREIGHGDLVDRPRDYTPDVTESNQAEARRRRHVWHDE